MTFGSIALPLVLYGSLNYGSLAITEYGIDRGVARELNPWGQTKQHRIELVVAKTGVETFLDYKLRHHTKARWITRGVITGLQVGIMVHDWKVANK